MSNQPVPPRDRGISRRELLRRGMILGGAVAWTTPALQSLAPPAFAQYARCGCCYCWTGDKQNPEKDGCFDNGATGPLADPDSCQAFCSGGAPGGPYALSEHCSAATSCQCNKQADPGQNGCVCF